MGKLSDLLLTLHNLNLITSQLRGIANMLA